MQLHLIRHTRPDIENGICYGWSDIPLKNTIEHEAKEILAKLPKEFDAVYTSPLQRCYLLAEKIKEVSGVPLIKDERLKELNFGRWEMQRWNKIDRQALNTWMENYESARCPGGESYRDVLGRVNSFLTDIKHNEHEHTVIVTHGGVIRAVVVLLHGRSLRDSMNLKINYGSVITCNLRG